MSIIIIGSGSWGVTLAGLFNPEQPVRLWCKSSDLVEPARKMLDQTAGADRRSITVEVAFSTPLKPEDIVIVAVPSGAIYEVSQHIREAAGPPYPVLVTASKGLERETFRTTSQTVSALIPGADRTVISAGALRALHLQHSVAEDQIGGLGGLVESVTLTTQIRLTRDDGEHVTFRGTYAACTDDKALDMSVLGRDILEMFAVILDRPADIVAIIGGNHYYTINQN